MTWLQIVVAVVSAVPALIQDIEQLIQAITKKPVSSRADIHSQLTRAISTNDPEEIKKTVLALKV